MREVENLIKRERSNCRVVLFFSNDELIGRRSKLAESNENRRELWLYDQADWPPTAHCKREK